MKLPLKTLIHTIFWLVFLLFSYVLSNNSKPGEWPSFTNITPHYIINFIWAIIIFYLFYFYFIGFFEKRQFVKYLIFSILSSIIITFIFLSVHKIILPAFRIFHYRLFGPPIVGTFILAQCGCLVRGFENWFTNLQQRTELENRSLKNELELLKSQINPHFLFNSLNNIDSLIQKSPEDASNSLITLSDMLRYMLYETHSDEVNLHSEIIYLKNYIKLQQLRYRGKEYVKSIFPDDCSNIQIAPMLLIPFIENAFKYSYYAGKYPVIEIGIECKNNLILFTCNNFYKKEVSQNDRARGVGLENAKRRLELLYPGKYKLDISKENDIFKVELSLKVK